MWIKSHVLFHPLHNNVVDIKDYINQEVSVAMLVGIQQQQQQHGVLADARVMPTRTDKCT